MSRTQDRLVTLLLVVAALVVAGAAVNRRAAAGADEVTVVRAPSPSTTTGAAPRAALRAPTATTGSTTSTSTPTTTTSPTTTTTTRPPTTTTTAPAPPPSAIRALRTLVLTPDRGDRFDLAVGSDSIHWTAPPTNRDRNLRVLAWDGAQVAATDQQACATWTGHTDHDAQQGVALRVRVDGDRWRAITVTKNVLMAKYSNFNVHTWDTARHAQHVDGRPPLIQMEGTVRVEGVVEEGMIVKPLPWRLCARAVGDRVDLKVWPLADREPEWGDPTYGGTVALPPGWAYDGRAGWFAGHIPQGGHADADDLSAGPIRTAT